MKAPPRSVRQWLPPALFIAAVVVAYLPAMRGHFIWDDDRHVSENPCLRDVEGLARIWTERGATPQYYPLTHTTFWIEYHLWGLRPLGYHLDNVLLHAAGALVLWRILRRLELPGAFWAAAIWALHPLQVESVAWITERKNVLSGLLYLLAADAYLAWEGVGRGGEVGSGDVGGKRPLTSSPPTSPPPTSPLGLYLFSLLLFLASLLAKTVTASLPAALLLVLWWKRRSIGMREILTLGPMLIIGAVMAVGTAMMEIETVRAFGPDWDLTPAQRCLIAGRALCFYATKLVAPVNLTFSYPRWVVDPRVVWQWAFPAAAIGVVIVLWLLRRRIGRGPLVAALFFVGTLFPALGFADLYPMRFSFVADHFQYLAGIGLLALVVSLAVAALTAIFSGSDARGSLVLCAVVVALGVLSFHQARIYQDSQTIWNDTIGRNPGSWLAHNNLSAALCDQGQYAQALAQARIAAEIWPHEPRIYYNQAKAQLALGRVHEAIDLFAHVLSLNPEGPLLAHTHLRFGIALAQVGRFADAQQQFRLAIECDRTSAEAHNNLGRALENLGQIDAAIREYRIALALNPQLAEAQENLARALRSPAFRPSRP